MTVALALSNGALAPAGNTTMVLGSNTPATGNLLVARFSAPLGGLGVTAPAGWNHVPNDTLGKQVVCYRVCGGAEPASYTFTFNYASVVNREFHGLMTLWTGTDTTTPIAASSAATGSGSPASCLSLTTLRDQSVLYAAVLTDATIFNTPPSMGVFFADGGRADATETVLAHGSTGVRDFQLSGRSAWTGGFPGGGTLPAWASLSLVVQPPPAAPYTPTLQSPASGAYADVAAGFTASWSFTDPDAGDTHAKYALRRKAGVGGTSEYWKAATASWQGTLVYNTSSTPAATFPAAAWNNGTTYLWSVSTQDQTGSSSPFAPDAVLVGSAAPTLTVTSPTGTITATTSPAFAWTFGDPDGDPEESWRAKVFTDAVHGAAGFDPEFSPAFADSGLVVSSAVGWQPPVDLDNSATYWAYVKAQQPGGQTTGWQSATFTLNVTPPAVPTSVTVTPDPTTARVLIAVVGPTDAAIALQRSDDGGTSWSTVRGGDSLAPDVSGHSSVYDYACPLNVAVKYRARSVKTSGGTVASAWTSPTTTTLVVADWWLKHASDHTYDTPIDVPSPFAATRNEVMGVFAGLSSSAPVVVRDVIQSAVLSFTVEVIDPAVRAKITALRGSQSTLLLQSPFLGEQWWCDVTKLDDPLSYADGSGYMWQVSVEAVETDEP